jgi:ribosomal-protein-alanine N-acetyltransferase
MMNANEVIDFYQNLPQLEMKQFLLRKVTKDDVLDIFSYASDEKITRYLRWGPHLIVEDTRDYVNEVLTQYEIGQDGPWGIEYKPKNAVIGHIHLMEIDTQHNKAQVGFVLARAYWNQGIMTEVLRKILSLSLTELGLNRVEGICIEENRAAKQVLEKAGMKREGKLREYLFQKGQYWGFSVYAILQKEYQKISRGR